MLGHRGRVVWWRWRRNPLKRRSDTVETWIGVALVAMLLLAAPIVGRATAAVAERAALDQSRDLHRVTARLVEDAPATTVRFSGSAINNHVRATVWWTTADDSPRTDTALVKAGTKAGAPTAVWLDDAGRMRPAPPTAAQASSQGVALGTAAGAGVCMLALGIWWIARLGLEGHRRSQWERAWSDFDRHRGHRHA
ncbi:hypothetical protein F7R91_29370 [Streptomyces luteolifulvus]|uniref:Transmembrane protein n=1 Tax=Streptomyces luteolifulvus TaxID=2615112 RepID=A0A6H9USJ7_9ACTN|nr:hypothetical protein [Streptomyces luteolifulvus]KAB1142358.1 hypothetical protein F7R91_29370 [Streptomyces luteolifulvus]